MLYAAQHRTQYFIAWQETHQRKSFILLSLTIMQEDMNDVQLMIDIKIYTKKLYQNVIMYLIFVSKIVLTHKFYDQNMTRKFPSKIKYFRLLKNKQRD